MTCKNAVFYVLNAFLLGCAMIFVCNGYGSDKWCVLLRSNMIRVLFKHSTINYYITKI